MMSGISFLSLFSFSFRCAWSSIRQGVFFIVSVSLHCHHPVLHSVLFDLQSRIEGMNGGRAKCIWAVIQHTIRFFFSGFIRTWHFVHGVLGIAFFWEIGFSGRNDIREQLDHHGPPCTLLHVLHFFLSLSVSHRYDMKAAIAITIAVVLLLSAR
ncbi:hypothetical protein QBC38DRAFT_66681 [Podospora fimiseda]|uniref:Secreted protein n=1 Tax=Podospora fimiseda TaxID=252190 RepID=A0AAN7BG25_9PEZI|nr:hypothetical protein QBC38DRAFT_66681 [Podospora fimiseda]